ncbi:MAG: photosynthetic reaction center subunit H [Acidocella sp.]|nr:photosynthetic reaction center subunit H [Acidocella sp.]
MQTGAITPYIDVAQLTLYAFWIFFAGLVIYLTMESKREGFPLITNREGERPTGILPMPAPKTFIFADGTTKSVPMMEPEEIVHALQHQNFEGAPWVPTGDPMQDGMGPAGYALRATTPELTFHGEHRTVPLRVAADHWVAEEDPDPRGWDVITADHEVAGTVSDIWIDRAEANARFIEVATPAGGHVIVPIELTQVETRRVGGIIRVVSVTAAQLAAAPHTESPDCLTAREEDRIQAYFASGHLYAFPSRQEPLI